VPTEVNVYDFELGTLPFETVLGAGVRSASCPVQLLLAYT
jgi:hypothetical protein